MECDVAHCETLPRRVGQYPLSHLEAALPDPSGHGAAFACKQAVQMARRQADVPGNGRRIESSLGKMFRDVGFGTQTRDLGRSAGSARLARQREKRPA
ncbi:hypothetical protein D3C86_1557750 [compost metagenome]